MRSEEPKNRVYKITQDAVTAEHCKNWNDHYQDAMRYHQAMSQVPRGPSYGSQAEQAHRQAQIQAIASHQTPVVFKQTSLFGAQEQIEKAWRSREVARFMYDERVGFIKCPYHRHNADSNKLVVNTEVMNNHNVFKPSEPSYGAFDALRSQVLTTLCITQELRLYAIMCGTARVVGESELEIDMDWLWREWDRARGDILIGASDETVPTTYLEDLCMNSNVAYVSETLLPAIQAYCPSMLVATTMLWNDIAIDVPRLLFEDYWAMKQECDKHMSFSQQDTADFVISYCKERNKKDMFA